MLRRRDIAASPTRRADEAWAAVVQLIVDTLERSETIDTADVLAALNVAGAVGPRLVGGRHLEQCPVVLVADPVRLSIYTVSGADAVSLEENLAPVPGGASASNWKVYIPAPEPLAIDVAAAVAGSAHLSADPPPASVVKALAASDLIDLDALALRLSKDTA
jgi:hypothetical protein